MRTTIILFEDHTAQDFRPLAWSVPVYEMSCGLFNLRERIGMLAQDDSELSVGLLPRGELLDLQDVALPEGMVAGPEACAEMMSDAERVLWISARGTGDREELRAALDDATPRADVDEAGLTLCSTDVETAAGLLASWRVWDAAACADAPVAHQRIADWRPEVDEAAGAAVSCWRHLWDRVAVLGEAVVADLETVVARGRPYRRHPFGCRPGPAAAPAWAEPDALRRMVDDEHPGVLRVGEGDLWTADDVRLDPGAVLDVRHGPIVFERGARVGPCAVLAGPLVVGPGATIKAHAAVGPEVVIGPGAKVAGEIAESQFAAYANKQHAGFIGHAVIGSWVNLGADTTCSDLKNNYGVIKVNFGQGAVDTGLRFVGLMVAEHAKSAIGTTFNTATTVGFSANVFAEGFPRTLIPNFSWGDGRGKTFKVDRALETARIVMGRRGMEFTSAHEALFRRLAGEGV